MTQLPGLCVVLGIAAAACQPLKLDPFLYDPLPATSYTLSNAIIPAHEDLLIPTEDGQTLHAVWVASSGRRPDITLLYFHGQSNNIGTSWPRLELLYRLGFNLVTLDPRGYGKSTGTPNEAGINHDLRAFYDVIVKRPDVQRKNLIHYGRSFGGAWAIELSIAHPPAVLITESAFTSVAALIRDGVVVDFPRSFVARDAWDNLSKVAALHTPALFLHGSADPFVQPRYARELATAHPGPHELILVPGADHGDVPQRMGLDVYLDTIRHFIETTVGP